MQTNRDKGLKMVTLGIELFNGSNEIEDKQKAYQAVVKGIEILIQSAKELTNPQMQQLLKQKIIEFVDQAEKMKSCINNVIPQKDNQDQVNQQHKEKKNTENEDNEKLRKGLESAIVKEKPNVKWEDVSGLENAKKSLQEAVILPVKFPQMFVGMRKPWKGILLYGPPGTGKSLLAKACATECDATFFSISSSDLISKYVGESEKLVRALFEMARAQKPSIIFIDEIDSMAGSRTDGENDSSRRVKTEFLVQMQGSFQESGVGKDDEGILVLGATNIPWGLDMAIRRRFEKRIYISLPCKIARAQIIQNAMCLTPNELTFQDIEQIADKTEGFSGSDMSILIRMIFILGDASYQPLRKYQNAEYFLQINSKMIPCDKNSPNAIKKNFMDLEQQQIQIPAVTLNDFLECLLKCKASVGEQDIQQHIQFTKEFGQDG